MQLTLTIPDDLAAEAGELSEAEWPDVLSQGLKQHRARTIHAEQFDGLNVVLETLASLPSAEQVLALRPSRTLQERIDDLLRTNQTVGLSPTEEREWKQYEYIEHIVRLAKAQAARKLNQP